MSDTESNLVGEGEEAKIQDGFPGLSFSDDHHHTLNAALVLKKDESGKKLNELVACIENLAFNLFLFLCFSSAYIGSQSHLINKVFCFCIFG